MSATPNPSDTSMQDTGNGHGSNGHGTAHAANGNGAGRASGPPFGFADPALDAIKAKLDAGERLEREDGVRLFQTHDLHGLGWLANRERERRHGNKTYYNINRHINYSNVCTLACKFCAFARQDKNAEGAWTYALEEIFRKAEQEMPPDGDELHIVGGLHPDLPYEYYVEMMRGLKARLPHVHLKAFTAIEIAHLAKISKKKVTVVLEELRDAGLGSLPGGGAEVLTQTSRDLVCGDKMTGKGWLSVHRMAHKLGIRTNCTLLYGHVESIEDRVDHMLLLRGLQDETHGFQVFIPLAFHPENTEMEDVPGPSGITDLKTIAVGRLMLDNFDNIKSYWIMVGPKIAQIAQDFGANDIDGTVVEETIYHMAGAQTPQGMNEKELHKLIREAGRVPVRRNTLYQEIGTAAVEAGSAA